MLAVTELRAACGEPSFQQACERLEAWVASAGSEVPPSEATRCVALVICPVGTQGFGVLMKSPSRDESSLGFPRLELGAGGKAEPAGDWLPSAGAELIELGFGPAVDCPCHVVLPRLFAMRGSVEQPSVEQPSVQQPSVQQPSIEQPSLQQLSGSAVRCVSAAALSEPQFRVRVPLAPGLLGWAWQGPMGNIRSVSATLCQWLLDVAWPGWDGCPAATPARHASEIHA